MSDVVPTKYHISGKLIQIYWYVVLWIPAQRKSVSLSRFTCVYIALRCIGFVNTRTAKMHIIESLLVPAANYCRLL